MTDQIFNPDGSLIDSGGGQGAASPPSGQWVDIEDPQMLEQANLVLNKPPSRDALDAQELDKDVGNIVWQTRPDLREGKSTLPEPERLQAINEIVSRLEISPEDFNNNIQLADKLGISLQSLQDPNVRKAALWRAKRLADNDPSFYKELVAGAPVFARKLTDHGYMAAMRDDMQSAKAVEELLSAPKLLTEGYQKSDLTIERGHLGWGRMQADSGYGTFSDEQNQRTQSIESELQKMDRPESFFGGVAYGTGEFGGQIVNTSAEALTYGAGGAVAGGLVGGGIGYVVPIPGGAATGARTGARWGWKAGLTAGGAKEAFIMEAGNAYEDLRQMRDENGKPLDPDTIRAAAFAIGAFNAGLEMAQVGIFIKAFPGANKLLSGFAKSDIEKLVVGRSYGQIAGSFAKGYVQTVAGEAATETMQEVVSIGGEEWSKSQTNEINGTNFQPTTQEDITDRFGETAYQTAQGMVILGGMGPSAHYYRDVKAVRKANKEANVYQQMGDLAKENKAGQINPRLVEEHVAEVVKQDGAPYTHVYVPLQVLQQEYGDVQGVADTLNITPEAINEAAATGSKVAIPIEKWQAHVAPTEHHENMKDYVTLTPDGHSIQEAAEIETDQEELGPIEDKATAEQKIRRMTKRQESEQVFREVEAQLIATGMEPTKARVNAAIWGTRSLAASMMKDGLSPLEWYRNIGLEIRKGTQEDLSLSNRPAPAPEQTATAGRPVRELGSLSEKYESSGDAGSISSGEGDSGGVSYGAWQMSSVYEVPQNFVGWLNKQGHQYGAVLQTAGAVNSSGFKDTWKSLAAQDPVGFKGAQKAFIKQQYYDPATSNLLEQGFDISKRSPVLQDVLWSNAVQHAPVYGAQAFTDAAKRAGKDLNSMTDAEIIENLYSLKVEDPSWSSGSPALREGLFNRWNAEKADALAALGRGEVGASSNSGITGQENVFAQPLNENVNLDAEVPILTIQKPLFSEMDFHGVRSNFPDDVKRSVLAEFPVVNEQTGNQIQMTGKDFKHAMSSYQGQTDGNVHYEALAVLPQLIQQGYLIESHGDAKNQAGVKAVHRFYSPLQVDGEIYTVKMTVKEYESGVIKLNKESLDTLEVKKLYHSEVVKKIEPTGSTPLGSIEFGRKYPTESTVSISDSPPNSVTSSSVIDPSVADQNFHTEEVSNSNINQVRDTVKVREMIDDLKDSEGEYFVRPDGSGNYGVYGQGVDITQTEAFKKWFGDSKVVDKKGNPMVVYHGGPDIRFAKNEDTAIFRERSKKGFFFTGNLKMAYTYADPKRAFDYQNAESGVIPVYLSIQNPLIIDYKGERWRASKETYIEEAKENGHDGVILKNVRDSYHPDGKIKGDVYIAFEPSQIKSIDNLGNFDPANPNIYQQEEGQILRGEAAIREGRNIISLFENEDASTFVHESAHIFLDDFARMALSEGTTEQFQADFATLKEHLKITDQQIEQGRVAFTAKQQEQFADEFVQYMMDGKAPNIKLRNAFRAFKQWLVHAYENLLKQGKKLAEISPEVRGVMDRMLSTEEDIETSKDILERFSLLKMNTDGMSENQLEGYLQELNNKVELAKEELLKERYKELRRQKKLDYQQKRDEIELANREGVESEPVYQAVESLANGETEDGVSFKLNSDYVKDVYGEEFAKTLPARIMNKIGILHPDDVAAEHGYQSGRDLLEAIANREDKEGKIKRLTKEQLDKLYIPTAEDLREMAQDAINQEAGFWMVEKEMNYLKERLGSESDTSFRTSKAQKIAAKYALNGKKLRDILGGQDPNQVTEKGNPKIDGGYKKYFWQAENEGRAANRFYRKNQLFEAARAKERQMLNMALGTEGASFKVEYQKNLRYFRRFLQRRNNNKLAVHTDELGVIVNLLKRFGFEEGKNVPNLGETQSLGQWFRGLEEFEQDSLVELGGPLAEMMELEGRPVMELTVGQFRDLRDMVKVLEKYGANKNKLFTQAADVTVEEASKSIASSAYWNVGVKYKSRYYKASSKKLSEWADKLNSWIIGTENIIWEVDGRDYDGPLRSLTWAPLMEAFVKEQDLQDQASDNLTRIWSEYNEKEMWRMDHDVIAIKEIDDKLTKKQIMMVAANMGSNSNYKKLLGQFNEGQIEAITKHMDERDWRTVKAIWDYFGEIFEPRAKMHKEVTGIEPRKVELREVDTPIGKLEGGYFPLRKKMDSIHNAYRPSEEIQGLRPKTDQTSLKERVEAAYELALDDNVVYEHLQEWAHDVSHRKTILDVNKLLYHDITRKALQETIGPEKYKEIIDAVRYVAKGSTGKKYKGEEYMRKLRTNAVSSLMAGKATVVFQQISGLMSSMGMLGISPVVSAAMSVAFHPDTIKFIKENSAFMKERGKIRDRDIADRYRSLVNNRGGAPHWMGRVPKKAFDNLTEAGMSAINFMDMVVSVPTWWAGYQEGLRKFGDNETEAIHYADTMVKQSQGSGLVLDQAAFQREGNEYTKLLTMFMTPTVALYRLIWRNIQMIKKGDTNIGRFTLNIALAAIGQGAMAEILAGRGPDDDEDRGMWAFKQTMLFAVGAIPVVRDMARLATGESRTALSSPVIAPLESAGKTLYYLWGANFAKAKKTRANAAENAKREALKLTGFTIPYPQQLNIWGWNIYDWSKSGKGLTPADFMRMRPVNKK